MKLKAVCALLLCVGLAACGDDADDAPPPEKRKVSVLVNDMSKAEVLLKFRAEGMSLGDVVRKVGPLTKSQTVALRCEGGYNKQPPLYSLDFDIISGSSGPTENLQGIVDTATMHDVCMKKARSRKN